ncbi:MAG: hypothetical protein V4692_12120 [Bdellovibrionota bacterium]
MSRSLIRSISTFVVLVAATITHINSAQAISLRFKSKVFSSGPVIYACNAGIGSEEPNIKVCYFDANPAKGKCTPLACDKAKENCDTSCVCTGTNGGAWLPTYLTARAQTVDADGAPSGSVSSPIRKSSVTAGVFSPLFTGTQAWNQKISDVGTYFPQELYTGKYFVDVCYRGSNIPDIGGTFTISTQASAIPFRVTDPSGFNSLDNNRNGLDFDTINNAMGLNYVTKANLTVQTFVVCSTSLTTLPEFALNSQGVPTGGVNSTFYNATSAVPLTASAVQFAHGSIIDPKFCKVRYIFKETNYTKPNPLPRDHKSEGAEICTFTDIEDPAPAN